MSSKLKKAAGKKEKGKKAAGSQRHMMPHEIASVIGDMVTSPREMTTKPKKGQPVQASYTPLPYYHLTMPHSPRYIPLPCYTPYHATHLAR